MAASIDVLTQVATEAAQRFIESYYPALQSDRDSLASFYVSPGFGITDGATPTIVINGNTFSDAGTLQTVFQKQMPQARYEVQSFDCHTLNPNLGAISSAGQHGGGGGGGGDDGAAPGQDSSILLTVNGYARFGEARDAPVRGFSESIILVPNAHAAASRGRGGGAARDWVIQFQNFRLMV